MVKQTRVGKIIHPNRCFHITRGYLGKWAILKPSGKYEPVGISFSPTIRGCLEGTPFYYTKRNDRKSDWQRRKKFVGEGNLWYVYTPINKVAAIIPDRIDDFERTRERRVLGRVSVKYVGRIVVNISERGWEYKWI